MRDKKQLHHLWTKVRPIKTIYLLGAFLVMASVSVWALRSNNITMVRLRTAVYQADQQNGDVNGALNALRNYVYAHMNTNLTSGNSSVYPPIQLKYTYDRLQAAQLASLGTDSAIYTQAQKYCEQQDSVDFSGHNRVPCIEDYVSMHGSTVQIKQIPDSMYKFNFISPTWSPDLAGWTLVASFVLLVLAVLRFTAGMWLRQASK